MIDDERSTVSFRYTLKAWITWLLVAITVAAVPIFFLGGGVQNLSHMNSRRGGPLAPAAQSFWQAFFALGLSGWAVVLGMLVYRERTGKDHRIDCGATSMSFSKHPFSRQRLHLDYSEIASLSSGAMGSRRWLEVATRSERYHFSEVLFESARHFDDFARLLTEGSRRALGPSRR